MTVPVDRPNAQELIASAAEHLATNVRPALSGHAAFEALITANLPLFNKVIDSVRPQNQ